MKKEKKRDFSPKVTSSSVTDCLKIKQKKTIKNMRTHVYENVTKLRLLLIYSLYDFISYYLTYVLFANESQNFRNKC